MAPNPQPQDPGQHGPPGAGVTVTSTTAAGTVATAAASVAGNTSVNPTVALVTGSAGATAIPINSPIAHHGSKLSNGAVAGVAVGSAIAGALIAGLLFFLFFKRTNRRGSTGSGNGSSEMYSLKAGERNSSTIPVPSTSAAGVIESNLPQPMADSAIGQDLSSLDTRIANHVTSYYSTGEENVSDAHVSAAVNAAAQSGADLPITAARLAQLLSNPQHRAYGLRVVIGSMLLGRIGMDSPPEESLLPPGVANVVHAMPQIGSGDNGKFILFIASSANLTCSPVRMAFLTKWRTLTSFLLRNSPTPTDAQLRDNIKGCVSAIDAAISPFASSSFPASERISNLEAIVQRGSQVAAMLFSQPAFWKFSWGTHRRASGSPVGEQVVVFPALQRLTDGEGKPLSASMLVEESKTVHL
jgi:hypothetical protein